MKKLISLLMIFSFAIVSSDLTVSCKNDSFPIDDGNIGVEKDAEILNTILRRTIKSFLDYAQTKNIINSNSSEYQNQFDELYSMVDKNKSKKLDQNDKAIEKGLKVLKDGFIAVFNNICQGIIYDYPNYYIDKEPIELLEDSFDYNLNFINMDQLNKILGESKLKDVKAVRLDFRFRFFVEYKLHRIPSEYLIQYVITNDSDQVKVVLDGMVTKFSRVINEFFVNEGVFQIDQNEAFKSIYDNFDINYTNGFTALDKIILEKLQRKISETEELKTFLNDIKYIESSTLLSLLTSAINNKTNGIDIVSKDKAPSAWTGIGYQYDQITAENFVKFYRSLVTIFKDEHKNFVLADFNVNLAKIEVAGFPLSGLVNISKGEPLKVIVGITDQGLTKKLMEFGQLVAAFFRHFKIEARENLGVLHLSEEVFNKLLQRKDPRYKHILPILMEDFKKGKNEITSPGINIFNIYNIDGTWRELWLNEAKDTFTLKHRSIWDFSLYFGSSEKNAIYYTLWTSTNFGLEFTKNKI